MTAPVNAVSATFHETAKHQICHNGTMTSMNTNASSPAFTSAIARVQLRAYKSGKVAKEHNPRVAADIMGHSVSTAIRRYSNITDAESRSDAPFLASLTSVVLTRSEARAESSKPVIPITAIPAGGCEDHGHPEALADNPLVKPDCKKTEGCFFCNKFHVHADEDDCVKLMSCRSVLERLAPNRNPENFFAQIEQAAFSLGNTVPVMRQIKSYNAFVDFKGFSGSVGVAVAAGCIVLLLI